MGWKYLQYKYKYNMYGMEIPARVISLWRWDQLGLDGGQSAVSAGSRPLDKHVLAYVLDLLDYVHTSPYI